MAAIAFATERAVKRPPVRRSAGRPHRRARAAVAGVLLLPSATGCYSYRMVPAESIPPGTTVALGVNDRGRVGLGDRIGPGVLRVQGQLTDRFDSLYVVRVSTVEFIGGRIAKWSGETIPVPRDFVGTVSERRPSRTRTWLAVGAAVAAAVVLTTTTSLIGGGGEEGDTKVPPPPPVGQ